MILHGGHDHLAVQNLWWQNEFALLSLREGRWVALGAAGRPVPRRLPMDSRSGRLAESSPDGRLWYATHAEGAQAAAVVAVDCPEDVLADPPRPIPRWSLRPDGLHASDD